MGAAAAELVGEWFLLEEDAQRLIAEAEVSPVLAPGLISRLPRR